MALSSESRLPYYALHECEWLPTVGAQVLWAPARLGTDEPKFWSLVIFKEAVEADLLHGVADYIGELLERHQYPIRHCPYCGAYLLGEVR